jgi:Tol biopolymer transport system component
MASVSSDGVGGDDLSWESDINADGRFVAFESGASNLVPGDTNGVPDIFVRDRATGTTERVSVSSEGVEGNSVSWNPAISPDGRYVVFMSYASNLVTGDTNLSGDIFVHDRQTGVTERVSVSNGSTEGNGDSFDPAVSTYGRYVAFISFASNLVTGDTNNRSDIFVHDRQTGVTERVSVSSAGAQSNGFSELPDISGDGRFVTYYSAASNLVQNDTN